MPVTDRAQHMRDVLLEVNVNCKLGHPNVVHFHGVAAEFPADGKAKGVFLGLVFEFCDGGSLFQRLHESKSRAKMTIPQKVSTLYQIACGAEHMHSLNIVHRDLSDMNILLCSNGDVKIADLGCARQLNATTYRPSTISGSPPFMAPEQLQGKNITLKVDVWALGVLIWEVFMERKPWENAKATAKNKLGGLEYMQKQMIQQKKDLPAVSWPQMAGLNILKATFYSCLDREATTRFTMLDAKNCLCELIEHVNGRMPASKLAQLKPLLEADLLDFYKKFNQDKIKTIAQAVSENGVSRAVLNAKLRIKYGVGLESFKSSQSAEQDTLVAKSVEEGNRHQAEFVKNVEHEQMPADAAVVVGGGADALGGGGGGVEYLQREADLVKNAET
jgi:serine/threonine protein kinase